MVEVVVVKGTSGTANGSLEVVEEVVVSTGGAAVTSPVIQGFKGGTGGNGGGNGGGGGGGAGACRS